MVAGLVFTAVRLLELITLVPIWGILSWFVNAYQPSTPPEAILEPFIVAIIATVYVFFTLIIFRRWGFTPLYIAILDLGFFGALIAGVVLLAPWVQHTNCIDFFGPQVFTDANGNQVFTVGGVHRNDQCIMLKSAWGLAIADIILFFFSACAALRIWHYSGTVVVERHTTRRRGYW